MWRPPFCRISAAQSWSAVDKEKPFSRQSSITEAEVSSAGSACKEAMHFPCAKEKSKLKPKWKLH